MARALVAASLLFALAAPSRAQIDPSEWQLDGCVQLAPDELSVTTCADGCSTNAYATQVPVLPGTIGFDLNWNIDAANPITYFSVWAGSTLVVKLDPSLSWCLPAPCSGSVPGLVAHVTPAVGLTVSLDSKETGCGGLYGAGGSHCHLQHWTFAPDVGIWPVDGALDAAQHGTLTSPVIFSEYAQTLALIGDLDGDGLADVAVGSFGENTAQKSGAGAVRAQSSATGAVLFEEHGQGGYERLGTSVAAVGDLDGDGVPDLAAGGVATFYAWSGASGAQLFSVVSSPPAGFGWSLAGVGDVNLDGVPDLAAGAPFADASQTGRVRVVSGKDGATLWEVGNPFGPYQARLGTSVAGVGDLNGDGRPDVLAGAPGTGQVQPPSSGRALLLSGPDGSTLATLAGDVLGEEFGSGVCSAGDADADGTPDFAVGASYFNGQTGLVRTYSGATLQPLFTVTGEEVGEFVGYVTQMSPMGDVNGDGHADLVLGAPTTYYGGNGRVEIVSGADGSALVDRTWPAHKSHFGAAVSGGLDFTGDGVPDMAVGAPLDDVGLPKYSGKAVLLSGVPEQNVAPQLLASGTLEPATSIMLTVTDGTPSAAVALVLGLSAANQPLKGGVLVPAADLVLGHLALDATGTLTLAGRWPAGLSGTVVWAQAWIPSPVAAHGFTASNGLALVSP